MAKALFPFLEYIVLQFFVIIIGLSVVKEKEIGFNGILKSWVFGQMLCFAVLQVMAVPMILMQCNFDSLFWSYISVCAVLFGFGGFRLIKKKTRIKINKPNLNFLTLLLMITAASLILWQAGNYFFRIHLDEDDARWLVQANDALEYGDLMTRNFDTGDFLGRQQVAKDATSPWPMMLAVVSRILHVSVPIFAHTIFATIELLAMYAIYRLIVIELFQNEEARFSFLLIVAIINLFFGGTVYTQSVFSLIRIWQGKATVAAIAIPLLLYLFICIHKYNRAADWVRVLIIGFAICLMSGIGVVTAAVMTGVYGAYNVVAYQRWKRIPLLALSMIPSVTIYLLNIYIKG